MLKQLAAETQLYPGAKLMTEGMVPKGSSVSLWANYETLDDFTKVEQFYQQLTSKAWVNDQTQNSRFSSTGEWNTYRKGAYTIAIYPIESPKRGFQIFLKWTRP